MKKLISFCLSTLLYVSLVAQADSTLIKLQYYKNLYSMQLIDTQEYSLLKAKLLGLDKDAAIELKQGIETKLFYDTSKLNIVLPAGMYLTLDEIKNKKPSLKCNANVRLRKNYDYQNGVAGNIMLSPVDNCIGKKVLDMDVWIYSDGKLCYINLEHLKIQGFYNPILTVGRFIAFCKNQTTDGVNTARDWGGSIASEITTAFSKGYKKMYVMDTKTAMLNVVDREFMLKTLSSFPTLYSTYIKEETIVNDINAIYLQKVNELDRP